MAEITKLVRMTPITQAHIVELPNGEYSFVGNVPVKLYYVEGATDEEIERGAKFGARFGPKRRTFSTRQEAIDLAAKYGHPVA